jgi:hypothetical protein
MRGLCGLSKELDAARHQKFCEDSVKNLSKNVDSELFRGFVPRLPVLVTSASLFVTAPVYTEIFFRAVDAGRS